MALSKTCNSKHGAKVLQGVLSSNLALEIKVASEVRRGVCICK
jgi:hypothetical protein